MRVRIPTHRHFGILGFCSRKSLPHKDFHRVPVRIPIGILGFCPAVTQSPRIPVRILIGTLCKPMAHKDLPEQNPRIPKRILSRDSALTGD